MAAYAVTEANSHGRLHAEPAPVHRNEFQRDRDRVVHSSAFRRLEYKTQVFINHEGDMFRTRLTHSLEVAQISRTIARILCLNEDLAETLSLAHDLGHTPFGHAGQDALNACMRDHGGFEHNLQSLRIVDVLEQRYAAFDGLNLTFDAREGILKHCSKRNARTLGELGRRFLEGGQPSLEAQLCNLADEIAYNNHDIDDGLRAGLLSIDALQACELFRECLEEVRSTWPTLERRRLIHEVNRRMISAQVRDLIQTSQANIEQAQPSSVEAVRAHPMALIGFSASMLGRHIALKEYLREHLYNHYRVYRMAQKSRRVVRELFTAMLEEPRLLPDRHRERASRLQHEAGAAGHARAVADYIAGMTDRFALAEYQRLFNPGTLT
ncbi:MAG: deoxyguanosinetriphosphate triphosphohydrolase [Gammaproteobacteria bacterium]|nr:deoxyguanosinetriphosphate triphosphohydrolase [Gammaproteobacteria bacterium]